MKRIRRCVSCAIGKRKCDQLKPACGRCRRLGKNMFLRRRYDPWKWIRRSFQTRWSTSIKHKATHAVMTIDNAIKMMRAEENVAKSNNITMTSIILSSPVNRKTILKFIMGSQSSKHLKTALDKNIFWIHHYTKRQNLEMLW